MRALAVLLVAGLAACAPAPTARHAELRAATNQPLPPAPPAAKPVVISIVGSNDFHGYLRRFPLFAGYVANVRHAREGDGAALLVDAGDMLQGTIASNLSEGASVIAAYNALGYQAAAIGNHEFDFGPVGPPPAPPGFDPQGALKARIAEARFPMLSANLEGTLPGVQAACLIGAAGVRVGFVGVLTHDTPNIVMPAYFAGLGVAPLAPAIEREAHTLRAQGADLVVVLAHAGGDCKRFDDPRDVSSCDPDQEIFKLAGALPKGLVDVIVAGHTHAGVAHFVNGIAVVEAGSYGRAFSRVDVTLSAHHVTTTHIFPPQPLCPDYDAATCTPPDYEGAPVRPDAHIAALVAPALAAEQKRRDDKLGVKLVAAVKRSHKQESALGNLFADLIRQAAPHADVGLMNGGGLRNDLPAGELSYGAFYDAMPFENMLATVHITGADLRALVARNLQNDARGIISLSGVRAVARCGARGLEVELVRDNGAKIRDTDPITLAVSDYLVSGGDDLFTAIHPQATQITDVTLRDAMAGVLTKRGGTLDPAKLLDAKHPRLRIDAKRPVRCPAP